MAGKKRKEDAEITPAMISEVMRHIGRKGGQATGVKKGFGALKATDRKKNAQKAAAARWAKQRKREGK